MRVTIHQPEHLPWQGFFHKMNMADVFLILDSVQFRKNYFQNRNKIRTGKGTQWITIPVSFTGHETIREIAIADAAEKQKEKNLKSIYQNYRRARCFDEEWDEFRDTYMYNTDKLVDFNLNIIRYIMKKLKIKTKQISVSELNVTGNRSELLLDICRTVGATTYISGISGREYLDLTIFKENNINVEFQEFYHPIYRQVYEPFIPCMSTIDLIFNYGKESGKVLEEDYEPRLKRIIR